MELFFFDVACPGFILTGAEKNSGGAESRPKARGGQKEKEGETSNNRE